jgi:hypothetical protein
MDLLSCIFARKDLSSNFVWRNSVDETKFLDIKICSWLNCKGPLKEENLIQKVKIGSSYYIFCSPKCYNLWLKA